MSPPAKPGVYLIKLANDAKSQFIDPIAQQLQEYLDATEGQLQKLNTLEVNWSPEKSAEISSSIVRARKQAIALQEQLSPNTPSNKEALLETQSFLQDNVKQLHTNNKKIKLLRLEHQKEISDELAKLMQGGEALLSQTSHDELLEAASLINTHIEEIKKTKKLVDELHSKIIDDSAVESKQEEALVSVSDILRFRDQQNKLQLGVRHQMLSKTVEQANEWINSEALRDTAFESELQSKLTDYADHVKAARGLLQRDEVTREDLGSVETFNFNQRQVELRVEIDAFNSRRKDKAPEISAASATQSTEPPQPETTPPEAASSTAAVSRATSTSSRRLFPFSLRRSSQSTSSSATASATETSSRRRGLFGRRTEGASSSSTEPSSSTNTGQQRQHRYLRFLNPRQNDQHIGFVRLPEEDPRVMAEIYDDLSRRKEGKKGSSSVLSRVMGLSSSASGSSLMPSDVEKINADEFLSGKKWTPKEVIKTEKELNRAFSPIHGYVLVAESDSGAYAMFRRSEGAGKSITVFPVERHLIEGDLSLGAEYQFNSEKKRLQQKPLRRSGSIKRTNSR